MKGKITINALIERTKDLKELTIIYNLIKKHKHFYRSRRKMYSQIIKKRKELRGKR